MSASGPWENRTHLATRHPSHRPHIGHHVVALHLNEVYSVQRYQYDAHPGVDHLIVRRHDEQPIAPWLDLQAIKDRLAPDGQLRAAVHLHPPRARLIDRHHLYHLWVMPPGWQLGIGLHPDDVGTIEPTAIAAATAPRKDPT